VKMNKNRRIGSVFKCVGVAEWDCSKYACDFPPP